MDNENIPCSNPELHVGYLFSLHYQSILPRSQFSRNLKLKEEDDAKAEEKAAPKKDDEEDPRDRADIPRTNSEVTDQTKEEEAKKLEGM